MFSEFAFQNSNPTHFGWVSERWLYSWILRTHSTSDHHSTHGVLVSCCIGQSLLPQFLHAITWLSKESTSISRSLSPGFFWTLLCSGREGGKARGRGEAAGKPQCFQREPSEVEYIYIHIQGLLGRTLGLGFQCKLWGFTSSLLKHPEGLKSVHKAVSLQMTTYRNHVKSMISQAGKWNGRGRKWL